MTKEFPKQEQEPKIERTDKERDIKVIEAADWLLQEVNSFGRWGNEIIGRISRGTVTDTDKEMILSEVSKLKDISSNMLEFTRRGMGKKDE